MGVFRNGSKRSGIFRNGVKVTGVWVNGLNRIDDDQVTGPRNTYTDWSNSGGTYNPTTSVTTGEWSAWAVSATPMLQQYLNEGRSRSVRTVVTASQNQVRTCTASGGCDGPYSRTITVTLSDVTTTENQYRSTEGRVAGVDGSVGEMLNPNYPEEFTQEQIAPFIRCYIDRDTGIVTASLSPIKPVDAEGNPITLSVSVSPFQQNPLPLIPSTGSGQTQVVKLLVSGEVPSGISE